MKDFDRYARVAFVIPLIPAGYLVENVVIFEISCVQRSMIIIYIAHVIIILRPVRHPPGRPARGRIRAKAHRGDAWGWVDPLLTNSPQARSYDPFGKQSNFHGVNLNAETVEIFAARRRGWNRRGLVFLFPRSVDGCLWCTFRGNFASSATSWPSKVSRRRPTTSN